MISDNFLDFARSHKRRAIFSHLIFSTPVCTISGQPCVNFDFSNREGEAKFLPCLLYYEGALSIMEPAEYKLDM